MILPGAAYTEKDGTWVNTEGRAQRSHRAVMPPGEAREDWRILRAFSEGVGRALPYDNTAAIRARLANASPVFASLGEAPEANDDTAAPGGDAGSVSAAPFVLPLRNYYQADAISRASDVMAECARVYAQAPAMAAE